ncbi:MAG TPA: 4Fe-4S binding protein, partial [Verrucomicrobiota bacterium]|nr:4Fe-4S binding protein [Verrucomicrobiota bacterium]
MNIILTRRIAQVFFFVLFLWFCVVTTVGDRWFQLRGWPVNWFLQLDPLVALGTVLTTKTLYAGLAWALATIALTVFVGRFFCGWLCPFGALHQFVGWLGKRRRRHAERVALNQYHPAQVVKYYVLAALLTLALFGSLQTGWLDPIPLMQRTVNLFLLTGVEGIGAANRVYAGVWVAAAIFVIAVLLNLWIPRFYCRFICPLGALFRLLVRWTPWRIGKRQGECSGCELCENHCEGACDPFNRIRIRECLLCMNCLRACRKTLMTYGPNRSAAGEEERTGVTRRGFIVTAVSGIAAVPAFRLSGLLGENWNSGVVRPPGSLSEKEFLKRCIKCGQCMRVCPTNVIQPAGLEAGIEGWWTPVMNFRAGSSGCQLNCIACGNVCPTAAIRPFSLDEKLGRGEFASRGPIRMGTAFVDRNRCLPWAMDVPCIVCQENCPVSPKAIYIEEEYRVIRNGRVVIKAVSDTAIEIESVGWKPDQLATGDYFLRIESDPDDERRQIVGNTADSIRVAAGNAWAEPPAEGDYAVVEVRLQRPLVDVQ